jgi:MFS family permease
MAAVADRQVSTFGALGCRDFRVFWSGFLVSSIGNTMQLFALGWLAVQLAVQDGVPERASLYVGVVGLARLVPAAVLGLIAGAVVDRVDRRTILAVEETCGLVSGAAIAVLTITEAVNVGWVLVYAAITAGMGCFERLTRQAILPGLAGSARMMSAIGLNSSAQGLAVFLGPMIGGLLIGPIGIGGLLLVNTATYLVALWSLARIPTQRAAARVEANMVASIRTGLAFVRDTPFMHWQLLLLLAVTIFGNPLAQLLPAFVSDVLELSAVELSWLASAMGIGGLLATVTVPMVGARRGRGLTFIASSLGIGLALALFGLQRSLLPALALVVVVAFMTVSAGMLCMMITQLTTPDELRGRVIGVQQFGVEVGIPAGTLLLGAAGSIIGIGTVLSIAGALLAVATVVIFLRAPHLRAIP